MKKLKYPPEFKAEVCEYAKKESISDSASVYNVNRNTISSWISKINAKGLEGFVSKRKKRIKIINDEDINKIEAFKKENPTASLNDIKSHFGLNCSISLISKRLKLSGSESKKEIKSDEVYFRYHIISRIKKSTGTESIYRFSLYGCRGNILAMGFSSSKNSLAICIFIAYSIKNLKTKEYGSLSKIVTNQTAINKTEFETIVNPEHNIVLKQIKYFKRVMCVEKDIVYKSKRIESAMTESYRFMIETNKQKHAENSFSAVVFNVDNIYEMDIKDENWNTFYLPTESKKTFYKVLYEINQDGDKAVFDFNYAKARNEYEKAYCAIIKSDYREPSLQIQLLFNQAKVYFYLEQFQTALMLFRDTARLFRIQKNSKMLGEYYYYIGWIYSFYQNNSSALRFLDKSVKYFKDSEKNETINALLFRSLLRKSIIIKDYIQAYKYCSSYIRHSFTAKNKEMICNSLSMKGHILYIAGDYKKAEKALIKARKYNIENKNYFEAINVLSNLLNILTFDETAKIKKIKETLKQLKEISEMINFPFIQFEAEYKIGIYYYQQNKMTEARNSLLKSLYGIKKYGSKLLYLSNLYYLGRALLGAGEYSKSVRVLNKLYKEAKKSGNKNYMLFASRIISIVYTKRDNKKITINSLKKVIKNSIKLKEYHTTGDSYNYLGDIYIKKAFYEKAEYCFNEAYNCFCKFEDLRKYDLTKEKQTIIEKIIEINKFIKL